LTTLSPLSANSKIFAKVQKIFELTISHFKKKLDYLREKQHFNQHIPLVSNDEAWLTFFTHTN